MLGAYSLETHQSLRASSGADGTAVPLLRRDFVVEYAVFLLAAPAGANIGAATYYLVALDDGVLVLKNHPETGFVGRSITIRANFKVGSHSVARLSNSL